jgi:hypothetical protein
MVRKSGSLKRMVPAFGLTLIASLVLGGLAAGSVSATTQHWYSCKAVAASSGAYTDSACQKEGKGNFEWSKLTSTPTAFALKGNTSFVLSGTWALTKTTITCTSVSAAGTIANPAGEGEGTLSTEAKSSLSLGGCSVVTGSEGCKIKGGGFEFNALKGTATEFEGGHAVKLEPAEGTTFASFQLESCVKSPFNGTLTLKGTLYATMNPATSSLEFTKAGSASFKMNGLTAQLEGTAGMETASGEALRLGLAPPVNTALPTTSPGSPKVGTTLTAGNGTWANEPTSYTYQWKRCSANGMECQDRPGATESTYTATATDESHTLMVQVTATNAGGSKSASSNPTAIVTAEYPGPYHWYTCQKVQEGAGIYEDAACSKEAETIGDMVYEWTKLKEGSVTNVTTKNTTSVNLKFIVAGTTYVIGCSSESGSGTVTNPSGGGAGILSGESSLLTLTGCALTSPKLECTVKGGTISSSALSGSTSALEEKPAVALKSTTEGGSLFVFTLEGSCGVLGGTYQIGGTLKGFVNNATSSLDFTKAGGSELKFGGQTTWLEGSIGIEMAGGGKLKLKP